MAAALAGGLAAGCGGGGGSATVSPEALVKHDGYTVIMALTPAELSKLGGEGVPEYLAPYLAKDAKVAVGMKGGDMEIVIQLTDAGAQLAKGQLATAGQSIPGATAHMDGNDVTFVGPVSGFGSDTATPSADTATPPSADTTPAPETPAAPQEQTGPLGTVFTPGDSTDMYGTVQVRLDSITYGVKAGEYAEGPAKGSQLVGLNLWAKADKLASSGDASVNITTFTVLGSDGKGYDSENTTASMEASNFSGDFKFAGEHGDGMLVVEMPKGVTVTAVKYTGGDAPVTWNVAK